MRGVARNLPRTPLFLASFVEGFPFSAITHTALYPIPSFRAQREILLALRCFLLLSQKVSRFPLSHMGRYTGMQKGSLDFARDDVAETAFFQHILYTRRGLYIPPDTVISSVARNLSCTPSFLASFTEGFPFPAVAHMALYRCARKIPRLRFR